MSFWVGAALLCAIAMAAVLAPWFLRSNRRLDRRNAVIRFARTRLAEIESDFQSGAIDADEYHQLTLEQQRRLLQETDTPETGEILPGRNRGRVLLLVFAFATPVCAGVFYFYEGGWTDWRVQQLLDRSESEVQANNNNRATLVQLRAALERRLAQRDDPDGRRRFMLAQLDVQFERYSDAAAQFGLLSKQYPGDAGIAAQYAQALYLASDRQLTPEVMKQAKRALQLDPNQSTALGLLGIAAFERRDYAGALLNWRHLLRLLPPNSTGRVMIERGVKEAEQKLGPDGYPGPKFAVSVSLAANLKPDLPPHGTLFVFAKAVDGPPMPLAVERFAADQLPLEVTLDNSMAMAPGMDLSSAKQVRIFARITASGRVTAEPGDLEGSSPPLVVADTTQKIALTIDRRLQSSAAASGATMNKASAQPAAAAVGPKLVVSVSLASNLKQSLPSHGTLFVFAKAVDGPPMPLAVGRFDADKLPLQVTLDDSMAMAPGMNLSSAKQVRVFARITASGKVTAEPGDLEGSSGPMVLSDKTQTLELKIDRRR